MKIIYDDIGGDPIEFRLVENKTDCDKAKRWANTRRLLALDTESTHHNCYRPGWELRYFQFGDGSVSYVIPPQFKKTIYTILTLSHVKWIGHNGPHDIRSIDRHLGNPTGIICCYETFIPAHHHDSRNQKEGGTGHGLKELGMRDIHPDVGKWEHRLKQEFKKIRVPIPGEFYKSAGKGRKKGDPKLRTITYDEGWSLIDPKNPAYIAYAGADPIITYREWQILKPVYERFKERYEVDHKIQQICDTLYRRGMLLDVHYTTRFRAALRSKAQKSAEEARKLGVENIYSNPQIIAALQSYGAKLTARTERGQYQVTNKVLHALAERGGPPALRELIHHVLTAKQLSKRREAYADAMLRQMDANQRIHPSIKALGARTTRMSVSDPALQQLPTRDAEEED